MFLLPEMYLLSSGCMFYVTESEQWQTRSHWRSCLHADWKCHGKYDLFYTLTLYLTHADPASSSLRQKYFSALMVKG